MSDRVLETLLKANATKDVIEEYKNLKNLASSGASMLLKPKQKCTEKQLAALAAGREKRRKAKG